MYLLDTNVFLKLWLTPKQLRRGIVEKLSDDANVIYVSAISAAEIVIKHAVGKLRLPADPTLFVQRQISAGKFLPLAISVDHALGVQHLPLHHSDPFDRLLIAQAQVEALTLVTTDRRLARYDVAVLLAS